VFPVEGSVLVFSVLVVFVGLFRQVQEFPHL
jgi:hypothetical protein